VEAAWAKQEVSSRLYGQDGGLRETVGIADTTHPERVADDNSFEVEVISQQFGDDIG